MDYNKIYETRDWSLDLLRILAAIAVITVHTAGTGLLEGRDYPLGSFNWYVCMIYAALVRWCVPIFVMISGATFIRPNKPIPVKTLFQKYILRVFVALLVWSGFYSITLNNSFFPIGGGSAVHLWYLTMIIGVYLTVPVLQHVPKKHLLYFSILWFLFLTINFVNKFTGSKIFYSGIERHFFTDYVGYFVSGYLLYHYKFSRKQLIYVLMLLLISLTVTAYAAIDYSLVQGGTNLIFHSYFAPNVVLTTLSLLVLIKSLKFKKTPLPRITYQMAGATFGIYLIHMYILIQVYTRVIRFVPNPVLFIPLIVSFTFIAGFLISYLIKKIPFISKYIV